LRSENIMKLTTYGAFIALAISLGSCSTNTNTQNRPLFPDGFVVIEAVVSNGLTGEPVTGVDFRVQVGHHVLQAEESNGIQMVYGVPNGTPLFVLADAAGFQSFIAKVTIWGSGSVWDADYYYEFYNVLMYPVGTAPADVVVSVYDADGNPIAGATVVATMSSASAFVPVDTELVSGVGILPSSVVSQTNAAGKTTLAGASLILGATYSVDVFGALDAAGVYLRPSEDNTIVVGDEIPEIIVFLNRPAELPVAITVNNEVDGIYSQLVVTFPYAVELCTTSDDHTWANWSGFHGNYVNDFDGIDAAPATTDSVTAALSSGGTVLTVGYVTNVANDANDAFDPDDSLWILFSGVEVKPVGASDGSCRDLTNVALRATGMTVDPEIHVNQP